MNISTPGVSSAFKPGRTLKSVLPSSVRSQSTISPSSTLGVRAQNSSVSRLGHLGRALRLFGQWRRVSRSGIPALNNCQCSYDDGVDTQDIEPLILEFLSNKFSKSDSIRSFIERYRVEGERFRSQLSVMLDDVARNMVTLSDKELALVLDAMEVSINSIEEMSAC